MRNGIVVNSMPLKVNSQSFHVYHEAFSLCFPCLLLRVLTGAHWSHLNVCHLQVDFLGPPQLSWLNPDIFCQGSAGYRRWGWFNRVRFDGRKRLLGLVSLVFPRCLHGFFYHQMFFALYISSEMRRACLCSTLGALGWKTWRADFRIDLELFDHLA